MSIHALIQKYSNLGIKLSPNAQKGIHLKVPSGVMTDAIKQNVMANKAEIIACLCQD